MAGDGRHDGLFHVLLKLFVFVVPFSYVFLDLVVE